MAWRLQQAGVPFTLIGSTEMPSAYRVAAGVINPVTGRWMTKTWNADTLLPLAKQTYQSIEQKLGIHIYHPIPEIRFCQNEDDVKRVGRRMRNPRYADVLGDFYPAGEATDQFHDPHGSFAIKQAAYVDLPLLVDTLQSHFGNSGHFIDQSFKHSDLSKTTDGWSYQAIHADAVLFCEGAATQQNPWFSDLPLKPVKGETLLCQCPSLQLESTLYHHKKWLLPYDDGRFRIGATYDEADLGPEPTPERAKELLEAAQSALRSAHEIEIQAHMAGIRPSTVDSRPIIGHHPTEPSLMVVNGLGSKGASTAPLATLEMCEHLLHQKPISEEIDYARFSNNSKCDSQK